MSFISKQFSTGNSTINSLHPGSTLKVVSKGLVEVTFAASAPKKPVVEGARFTSKYGPATIIRMTSTQGMDNQVPPEGFEFYIADGTAVVRLIPTNLVTVL